MATKTPDQKGLGEYQEWRARQKTTWASLEPKPEPAAKPAPKRKPSETIEPPPAATASLTDCLWLMGDGTEFKLTVQAGRNVVRADIARSGHSCGHDFETADLTDHALCGFLRAADDTLPR